MTNTCLETSVEIIASPSLLLVDLVTLLACVRVVIHAFVGFLLKTIYASDVLSCTEINYLWTADS